MNREQFENAKEQYKKFAALSEEEKQDLQIKICKNLDSIAKIYAENPMLSFYQLEFVEGMKDDLIKTAFLIKTFERFFGE